MRGFGMRKEQNDQRKHSRNNDNTNAEELHSYQSYVHIGNGMEEQYNHNKQSPVIHTTPEITYMHSNDRNNTNEKTNQHCFNDQEYYYTNNVNQYQSNHLNRYTDINDSSNINSYNENYNGNYNNDYNSGYEEQTNFEYDPSNPIYTHVDTEAQNNQIPFSGNDYTLNTYLGAQGEMMDPYQDHGKIYYTDDKYPYLGRYDFGEENDLSNSIINGYLTKEVDEYSGDYDDDANTLDKIYYNTNSTEFSDFDSSVETRVSVMNEKRVLPKYGVSSASTISRKLKLWNGNFIFDSPISKSLLQQYSQTTNGNEEVLSNEFKFMRYQAITCEPDRLAEEKFTARQLKYLTPRETELMIVITMYNEDHILLGRSLKGVMDNIRCMVRKNNSNTWGPDAWKKIVICIVSDGRSKINDKSLSLLSLLGCYQDGFAKDEINSKKVKMHAYEHTTMVNITEVTDKEVKLECDQSTVPVQMMFCLKEENQKKINSHRWAFEGFAELLQPNIVTLIDAGTMPGSDSIYQLWREFRNPQVGGACGEIKTDIGRFGKNLINPLVASQNFEYKMSNILDKTTESNFGFITVLPGAFSAYRFEAVKGQPLEKYFYGEKMESDQENLHFFSSNMYLAEDRILCFEIVTKKNNNWILKYCKESYASTDVPDRVPEFILQRRRWLNGSFFASVYSFCHFYKIWTSGHTVGRKLLLNLEFVYLFFNSVIAWFAISSYFLVFRILTLSIASMYHSVFNILSVIFLWLYGACILSTFILSLGNKPKSTECFYVITCCFFAILMSYMIFCSVFLSVKSFEHILSDHTITVHSLLTSDTFRDIVISIGSTYLLYLISSILYLQPWHMFTSFAQYVLLSPSYINVLNTYAFCNVHDISWGTKGTSASTPLGKIYTEADGTFNMDILVSSEEIQLNYDKHLENLHSENTEEQEVVTYEEKKSGYYGNVRSILIIVWIMANFIVVAVVLETGGIAEYIGLERDTKTDMVTNTILSKQSSCYFKIILWLVALSAAFRFIGCSIYLVSRPFKNFSFKRTAKLESSIC